MSQLITIILCTYRRVRTWYPVVITSVHHQTHHLPARPAHSLPGRVCIRALITWLSCRLREIGGAAGVTGQRGQEAAKLQTDRLPTLLTVQLTAQQDPVRLVSGMMQTMQTFSTFSHTLNSALQASNVHNIWKTRPEPDLAFWWDGGIPAHYVSNHFLPAAWVMTRAEHRTYFVHSAKILVIYENLCHILQEMLACLPPSQTEYLRDT